MKGQNKNGCRERDESHALGEKYAIVSLGEVMKGSAWAESIS